MSYIDQRECGVDWYRNNPMQMHGNSNSSDSKYSKSEYDFSNKKHIKEFPTHKLDVYDGFDSKFGHRMDAMKYCVENNIPFLRWNCEIYDWSCNKIDIDYYNLM